MRSGHWPSSGPAARHDAGLGSALVLAAVVALLGVLSGVLVVVQLLVAGAGLDAAADLAALAAASAATAPGWAGAGEPGPCERARMVAERNGAALDGCRIEGAVAEVVVSAPAPAGVSRLAAGLGMEPPRLHSRARAGPSGG